MMNDPKFEIRTERGGELTLRQAVLLYTDSGGKTAFATVHEIDDMDGEPVILPGKAMTRRAAVNLAKEMASTSGHTGFIPDTLLYSDGDAMVWWLPPQRRHIAFRAPELGAPERGEAVPHPGLIFAASSDTWAVWAVKGAIRPTPDTPLYQAPYFNVWAGGSICEGNVETPRGTTSEKMAEWNDAFFGSFFTHPNITNGLVKYRGGSFRFWKDMLDGKFQRFPERVLVPMNATVGDLLKGKGGSHA